MLLEEMAEKNRAPIAAGVDRVDIPGAREQRTPVTVIERIVFLDVLPGHRLPRFTCESLT
jgi:hypothetical protein